MPKFDFVIQNPPYKRTLHIDFFHLGLDILKEDGKMTIIEPSTWLINMRRDTGNSKKFYVPLQARVEGHVPRVVIENYNKEFNTAMYMPFSVTWVNKGENFEEIDYCCCGEKREAKLLRDCNLIGPYDLVKGILDKVAANWKGEWMRDHIIPGD